MGWFTVVSYFLCAVVSGSAAVLIRKIEKRAFSFWLLTCLLLVGLGINKQLDLQSLMTEMGRQIAHAGSWYDQRRGVQFWFVILFAAAFSSVWIWFAITCRGVFRRFRLAFWGLFVLLGFIIVRATSFHHFDEVIGFELGGIRMNWVFELTGIYIILAAGFREMILATIRKN
jgi:hypothetical protein